MSELQTIDITSCESTRLSLHVADNECKNVLLLNHTCDTQRHSVDISLADHAQLTLYHIQNAQGEPTLSEDYTVSQGKHSFFTMIYVVLGAQSGDFGVDVYLNGEHAECNIKGIFALNAKQTQSNILKVFHQAAHTRSCQDIRGLADDQANGSVISRVVVNPGAQKIQSHQSCKNRLLSHQASIKAVPELEIYADDVQCAHGATVGELDEQSLFYLRSRGIDEQTARAMLAYAFVAENIECISDAQVRQHVQRAVLPKLPSSERLEGVL